MSAIFGILRFDGAPVDAADPERMRAALAHRSPHGHGSVRAGPVALGHGRLRETREDRFDAQPIEADDLLLVADVRLDNRDELAARLDVDPAPLADSALLLHAYRRWGEACAAELIGDFAFAVWDRSSNRLLLARDHMGQRALLYHQGAGFLAFASEAKALLALPDVPRILDEAAVARHLCMDFHAIDGRTWFAGIQGVPGGTTLCATADGRIDRHRYWSIAAAPEHVGRPDAYYAETYRRILAEAVACRVRRCADPPGLLLSGGFDSGAIAGLAAPALPPGRRLAAVTAAPQDGPPGRHDARPGATLCREAMPHLDHRFVTAGAQDLLAGIDRRNAAADRAPSSLAHVLETMFSHLREAGCRVVMDGIGGDATLNPRRGHALGEMLLRGEWRRFLRELPATARHEGRSRRTLLVQALRHLAAAALPTRGRQGRARRALMDLAAPALRARLLESGALVLDRVDPAKQRDRDRTERMLALLQSRAVPNAANEAAARGLTLTRPMLDKRVVAFALAIPEHLHHVRGRNRHLARTALADVLPPAFQTRRNGQEMFDPDFAETAAAALPELRADLAHLRTRAAASRFVDFAGLDRHLAAGGAADLGDGRAAALVHAYLVARFVTWFTRDND